MINTLAWFAVILCPLWIFTTAIVQREYDNSFEKLMDSTKGFRKNYTRYNLFCLVLTLVAVSYLLNY